MKQESKDQQSALVSALKDSLSQRMARNPHYSMRAFARDLGISHTYLSLVFSGKKALSLRKTIEVANLLSFPRELAESLIRTEATRARGAGAKGELIQYYEVEQDKLRVLSEWYHLPILDLMLLKTPPRTASQVAKMLGIRSTQADSAIQRLLRLGLLEKKPDGYAKTENRLVFDSKGPNSLVREFHKQMIQKGSVELESGDPKRVDRRDFSGVTLTVDPKMLGEAKQMIKRFRRKLWEKLSQGDCTELYQLNIQLFPLTVEPKQKSRRVKP